MNASFAGEFFLTVILEDVNGVVVCFAGIAWCLMFQLVTLPGLCA
jgi:hypothetical protein